MYREGIDNSIRALFWRVIGVRVSKGGPPPQRQRRAGVIPLHNSQIFLEKFFEKFLEEFFGEFSVEFLGGFWCGCVGNNFLCEGECEVKFGER